MQTEEQTIVQTMTTFAGFTDPPIHRIFRSIADHVGRCGVEATFQCGDACLGYSAGFSAYERTCFAVEGRACHCDPRIRNETMIAMNLMSSDEVDRVGKVLIQAAMLACVAKHLEAPDRAAFVRFVVSSYGCGPDEDYVRLAFEAGVKVIRRRIKAKNGPLRGSEKALTIEILDGASEGVYLADIVENLHSLTDDAGQKSRTSQKAIASVMLISPRIDLSHCATIDEDKVTTILGLTYILFAALPAKMVQASIVEVKRRRAAWSAWRKTVEPTPLTTELLRSTIEAAVADLPQDHPEVKLALAVAGALATWPLGPLAFTLMEFYGADYEAGRRALFGNKTSSDEPWTLEEAAQIQLEGHDVEWPERFLNDVRTILGGRAPLAVTPAENHMTPSAALELIASGLVRLILQAREIPGGELVIGSFARSMVNAVSDDPLAFENAIEDAATKIRRALAKKQLPLTDKEKTMIELAVNTAEKSVSATGATKRMIDALFHPEENGLTARPAADFKAFRDVWETEDCPSELSTTSSSSEIALLALRMAYTTLSKYKLPDAFLDEVNVHYQAACEAEPLPSP